MTPSFHGRLASWVEDNLRHGNRKIMVLATRVVYKTSLLTIAMCLWLIINNPEVRILVVQASADKVKEIMNALMGYMRLWPFGHYFPECVPRRSDHFSEKAITVPREGVYPEPTISARGVDSAITGGHYDCHIFDDVVDEDSAWSDTKMKDIIRWFKNSAPLFVNRDVGIRIVIGTRWAMEDLYQYIIDAGNHATWITGPYIDSSAKKLGFEGKVGDLIFPEKLTEKTIEGYRQEMGDVFFSYQILNRPVVEGLLRFDREKIKYFRWIEYGKKLMTDDGAEYLVEDLFRTLIVDPSLGRTAESDEFAATIVGWHRRSARGFCLSTSHGRIDPRGQAMKIIELHKRWKPHRVGIEDVGYQFSLKPFTEEFMRKEDYWFYIEPIRPKQGSGPAKKTNRIEALQPFVMNGQIFFTHDQSALLKQLCGFQPRPDGSTGLTHDDLIDSLAYHVRYWKGSPNQHIPDYADDDDVDDWVSDDRKKEVPAYGLAGG